MDDVRENVADDGRPFEVGAVLGRLGVGDGAKRDTEDERERLRSEVDEPVVARVGVFPDEGARTVGKS